ncbi:MAG: hypothetical protein ACR2FO_04570 [Actinomycetota bacterium]
MKKANGLRAREGHQAAPSLRRGPGGAKGKAGHDFQYVDGPRIGRSRLPGGGRAVWSMWPGYLGDSSSDKLHKFLSDHSIPLSIHHASGHAYVKDLKRIAAAITKASWALAVMTLG